MVMDMHTYLHIHGYGHAHILAHIQSYTHNFTCTDTQHPEDIVNNIGTIGPNAEFTYTFDIVGLKLGKHELVVGLGSNQVELITGEKEVCTYELVGRC